MKSFCISLEKKKQTWPDLKLYFSQNGIKDVTMFPAVNGNEIGQYFFRPDEISNDTLSLIKTLGGVDKMVSTWGLYHLINKNNRKDHAQLTSWGAVGCSLSHILLWKQMVEQKLDSIMVFEDDVQFYSKFQDQLQVILQNIPEDADVVFFDVSRNFKSIRYNDIFDKILDRFFGTHAYIITNKGANKMLPYVFPIEIQIDSFMGFRANLGQLTLYTARATCGQKPHISSIQTLTPCTVCEFNENQIYYLNSTFGFLIIFCFLLVLLIIYFVWKRI
jgi:GR25 family glycosyltransferase involved in LPS biosynthesis